MIIACIDYLLLVIICLRYVSISYICRAIWLVAYSRYSGVYGYAVPTSRLCCFVAVPRVAYGSAAL